MQEPDNDVSENDEYMTEYEIRNRVRHILASPIAGYRKARQLLGLSRQIKARRRSLLQQRQLNRDLWDRNTASHLERTLVSLRHLHEDVRAEAFAALRSGGSLASF